MPKFSLSYSIETQYGLFLKIEILPFDDKIRILMIRTGKFVSGEIYLVILYPPHKEDDGISDKLFRIAF